MHTTQTRANQGQENPASESLRIHTLNRLDEGLGCHVVTILVPVVIVWRIEKHSILRESSGKVVSEIDKLELVPPGGLL